MNNVTRILNSKVREAGLSASVPSVPTTSLTNSITSNIKEVKREKREENKSYIYNNRAKRGGHGDSKDKISFDSVPAHCWRQVTNNYNGCTRNTCKLYDDNECKER